MKPCIGVISCDNLNSDEREIVFKNIVKHLDVSRAVPSRHGDELKHVQYGNVNAKLFMIPEHIKEVDRLLWLGGKAFQAGLNNKVAKLLVVER